LISFYGPLVSQHPLRPFSQCVYAQFLLRGDCLAGDGAVQNQMMYYYSQIRIQMNTQLDREYFHGYPRHHHHYGNYHHRALVPFHEHDGDLPFSPPLQHGVI
jgi:hypothetical protein